MAEEKQATDPAKLKLDNVRLSFPDIFEAKSVNKGEPRFSAHFILDKKEQKTLIDVIRGAIWGAAKEKWGAEEGKKIVQGKKFKKCLHDGEEKEDKGGSGYMAGYGPDVMFLSASSAKRPLVIDRDRTPLTKDDRRPYGGCYCNAIVRLWVQDNEFGRGVNAELLGVQFFKDGEPFGAAPLSPDDFEDLGGDSKSKDKGASNGGDDDEIPV